MQQTRETPTPRHAVRPAAAKSRSGGSDPNQRLLDDYQGALELMQQNKFDKARTALEKIGRDAPPEIAERVRVYLAVCERNGAKASLSFNTTAEHYDYAISLLNNGNFEEARDQFEAILANAPEADFGHYGMALLSSMTGQAEEALAHLAKAIELNPSNRIQARSDPDFIDMADDPRFTELLYPET
ncbi:MAG TPA: tetratricopeptide repeat protein [Acidobacteriaceae bacterium]|nr:tetratricopeptide repeat protein [Acidobacteriaceae bacterium]